MKMIKYKYGPVKESEKIYDLYKDVGWIAYTQDFTSLLKGMENSLSIITAWDEDKLVGLIRVIGDGETIIYVQDILVLEEYQGCGIGSKLLSDIFIRYESVRQKILLTDRLEKNIKFYEKNGMKDVSDLDCVAFMHMAR